MSTSPAHYRKPATRCVTALTPFLRHLNTGTLAFVLFVALALLSNMHGKEPETRESAPAGTAKSEVIIDRHHNDVSRVATETARQTMSPPLTPWQFMDRIINAFKGAFNDPSLIEYANQQGIGIADSPTAPLLNTSSEPPAHSKSPSSQSSRSSSSY